MTALYEDDAVVLSTYADVRAFFAAELAPIIERRVGPPRGVAWCSRWFDHPEAVARLTALMEAFEDLHAKGGSWRSTWLLRHVDPHLLILFDGERGPFWRCADGHGGEVGSLPPCPAEQ